MQGAIQIHHLRNKIWLVSGMFVALITLFAWYTEAEKALEAANNARFISLSLAKELRQSSDDLTRMMRTYVVTGDLIYKQHFQEIIDIRNGLKALPDDYQNGYWDLVLNDDHRPRGNTNLHMPLLDRMKLAGITQQEFDKLAQAKANSDTLTKTEFAAMQLVEQEPHPSELVRFKAIQMLSDASFHKAKSDIMTPISEFTQMVENRTAKDIDQRLTETSAIRIAFVVVSALMLWTLWTIYKTLQNTLGASADVLHRRIADLGSGNFYDPIKVPKGMENSILGRLSQMQVNLACLDTARKTAEEKLEISTQRLVNIINATQAGTWEHNVQTGALLINDRWASMLGYTIAELEPVSSATWERLTHPDDLEQAQILKQLHFENKLPVYETKFRMQHKEGHWVWMLARGSLLTRTGDGDPEWMAGSHLDISALEEANTLLRENEQQMRMMLNEMPIGIALVDGDDKIFFRNQAMTELFGYTEIDTPDMQSWRKLAYPDPVYREQVMQGWRNDMLVATEGRQIIAPNVYTITAKDGRNLDVEISGVMTSFGFLATMVDQTQNRQIQLQLAEAKALAETTSLRLTRAAEAAQLGIWERNLENNALIWDKRMYEIYEIPNEKQNNTLTFEDWQSRIHPDDVQAMDEKFQAALKGIGNYDPTFRIIRNDNSIRIIQTIAQIVRNKLGEPVKVLGINRDITDQHELENSLRIAKSEAEAANAAKSAFLATMSHEIRTPMNGMLGMIKLLTHTELTAQQLDYAKKAENATKALLDIINDILDFSKIEAGKFDLDCTPFELAEMLQDLSIVLSSNLNNKHIEILFSHDQKIPPVLIGDPLRLRQVLLNLTGNAVKFTEKGEVVLSILQTGIAQDPAGAKQVTLEFSVQDSGIGIAPDKMQYIFESFNQAESSTARRFGGTGLGLAISKHLVEMMGGKLQVSSTPGKGSRFYFALTLAVAAVAPKIDREMPNHPYKVLIVDDNEISREILVMMGNVMGWECESVDSGEEALVRIHQTGLAYYDVILMDWRMPGMDGWDTIHEIRAMKDGGSKTVIVMITAHGLEFFNEKSKSESHLVVDGYLFKPITSSMLFNAVVDATTARNGKSPRQKILSDSKKLSGLRILVVEDNRLNQQIAKELLEINGAQVELASNGIDGVSQALANKPAVILMDMQMPDIDGLEATRRILQHPEMKSVPIIAMTANAMESDREACLAAGMVDHVPKPIDLDQLIKSILRHATNHSVPEQVAGTAKDEGLSEPDSSSRLVDVDVAVNRLGGNRQFYEKIIAAVRTDGHTQISEFKKSLASGDLGSAARSLHTFKGLVATLGASTLAQLAASTEKLLSQSELGSVHEMELAQRIRDIENLLQQVMQELAAISPSTKSGTTLFPISADLSADTRQRKATLQQELATLIDFLKNNNMRSLAMCTEIKREHANWLDIKKLDLLLDIDETVNQLNFTHALALCNNLIEIID
jgi:PAS domain S-box-containing protein